ncbi:MAG: type I-U CRISPR-associated protein Cas5/Cas6 [Candidatus Thermofonsia Clade 3 bacterium]|jgi:CRISPR-associated protein Csb2|uniref:Type I-U CRISPR-associated protein Cas5/Cas6 n=1 Tax=Candidatus Thermofonsia Clade 3 bacterium TaxID=2364212 RepID=A0A2M8QA74_9CHLR|nr:type I-U CRISPR-associated protein Csb2 [Candidatus Roseilinea sp. NK_OTU-006]PJF46705.1 MAG: type I-U CRISPR-associated protein Cas5/Cas6 [Candidatus Thermofonsia Clade 3 bacterium]
MFSIAIRYLCGWASAASNKKEEPEWPPHPDRVFMALVAAWAETGADSDEENCLLFLQALHAPKISASLNYELHAASTIFRRDLNAEERAPVPVYVPANGDRREMKSLIKLMPSERKRNKRYFPAVIPESDTVYLIWPGAELPAEHRAALERLCAKVGYLGDTSSLVQMWVEDNPPPPTLVPTDERHYSRRLRVFRTLGELTTDYERDKEAGEYRPRTFKWGYYREPEEEKAPTPSSHFAELLVLRRTAGPTLDITDALWLAKTLRDAAISLWEKHIGPPVPEWLSGHTSEGERSRRENGHLAFVALPNVGHEHADGELKGVALAIPQDVTKDEQTKLLDALFPWDEQTNEARPLELTLGRLGVWRLEQETSSFPRMVTLRKSVWLGPAERWATVTPIVLDRYPKKGESEAEEMVAAACERIALPRPREVVLMPGSLFTAVPPARRFPALPKKFGKTRDQHTHALLIFDQPVRGPVLLGAGRYRGYGLCRPYRSGGDE